MVKFTTGLFRCGISVDVNWYRGLRDERWTGLERKWFDTFKYYQYDRAHKPEGVPLGIILARLVQIGRELVPTTLAPDSKSHTYPSNHTKKLNNVNWFTL
jgi:hypothetical protein